MYRLTSLLSLLVLLTAGRAFGYEVAGYYYTGAINGTLKVQMDLLFSNSSAMTGAYQYLSQGQYLQLTGRRDRNHVVLQECEPQASPRVTGTFTGAFAEQGRSFSGTWRSGDGKRSYPFRLQAVAEYRRLTKERQGHRVAEVIPYFYQATPAQAILNRRFWERAVQELAKTGMEEEGGLPALGSTYRIRYCDTRLLSISVTDVFGGGAHDYAAQRGENYLITGATPALLTWDDLLTPNPELRAELLTRLRHDARKTATDDIGAVQPFDETWPDISFALNASRLIIDYPRHIGAFGSYQLAIPYADMAPYLAEKSVLR